MKFGQYELFERIAVGGMAEVYKGRVVGAEGFEKLVAIKRIQPDLSADERFVSMLLTEARIHSALSHRNIVQIHDLGISEEGEYFIVLEYVEGYDLRAIMESITAEGEIIPEALSLHIAAEVAQALHFAHEMHGPDGQPLGLIHRDVSPSNVLISFAGEVKLSDFGLAKRRNDRSVVGSLKGNLIYMSPEQARQAPLDRRTDVFSLGALLFELLTGKRMREITDEIKGWGEVAAGVVRSARSARSDLPASFEALLNQALAADPNRRFPNAGAFGAAIRQLLSQMNTPVGPSDLQALLSVVTPPRKPRGDLERSKVIRLAPEPGQARPAAPAAVASLAPARAGSPVDRLRSASAGLRPPLLGARLAQPASTSASAFGRNRPAVKNDSKNAGDGLATTPPPVAGAPRRPAASGAARGGGLSSALAGALSSTGAVPIHRRRPSPSGSTLLGPAPDPPSPSAVEASAPARPNPPPPFAARPAAPLAISRQGAAGARGPSRIAGSPPAPASGSPSPWSAPPADDDPGPTPPPPRDPGPTPPPEDWSMRPTPPPAAVPGPHDAAPSAPTWRPAEPSRDLQIPEDDARASRPRLAVTRGPAAPSGLWRPVVVGLAALLVVVAFVVHVAVIPLEVLASWTKPAPLYISSEPEGGWAKLDGIRLVDPTPTKIAVARDRHEHVIEIEYPGFEGARQIVRFDGSVALSFMIPLQKEGEIPIAPVSAGARVEAPAPATGALPPGR